jgi:hypothetical protein
MRWEGSRLLMNTLNCRLMYDPFQSIVYDYVGGLRDLRKFQVFFICMHLMCECLHMIKPQSDQF